MLMPRNEFAAQTDQKPGRPAPWRKHGSMPVANPPLSAPAPKWINGGPHHFRAFAAAWHIPASAQTAQTGQWAAGPGAEFFTAVQRELGALPFIAEDLGVITPDVRALRDQFHLPGMRVLQFAFDGNSDNPYLPHNYISNTIVYTGTHDNPTTRGWYEDLPGPQRQNVWDYLKRPPGDSSEIAGEFIRLAWSSSAALAIAPLQDLLNLGPEARMNVPGRADGNWRWRTTEDMLSSPALRALRELTNRSQRLGLVGVTVGRERDEGRNR